MLTTIIYFLSILACFLSSSLQAQSILSKGFWAVDIRSELSKTLSTITFSCNKDSSTLNIYLMSRSAGPVENLAVSIFKIKQRESQLSISRVNGKAKEVMQLPEAFALSMNQTFKVDSLTALLLRNYLDASAVIVQNRNTLIKRVNSYLFKNLLGRTNSFYSDLLDFRLKMKSKNGVKCGDYYAIEHKSPVIAFDNLFTSDLNEMLLSSKDCIIQLRQKPQSDLHFKLFSWSTLRAERVMVSSSLGFVMAGTLDRLNQTFNGLLAVDKFILGESEPHPNEGFVYFTEGNYGNRLYFTGQIDLPFSALVGIISIPESNVLFKGTARNRINEGWEFQGKFQSFGDRDETTPENRISEEKAFTAKEEEEARKLLIRHLDGVNWHAGGNRRTNFDFIDMHPAYQVKFKSIFQND